MEKATPEFKKALERMVTEKGSWYQTPARILREMRSVKVFTDVRI